MTTWLTIFTMIFVCPLVAIGQQTGCVMQTMTLQFPSQLFFDSVSGDIDGDGDLDVITFGSPSGELWIFENENGKFSFRSSFDVNSDTTDRPHLADVDGDGDLDFLTTRDFFSGGNFTRQFVTALNDGLGNFSFGEAFDTDTSGGATPRALGFGDIDGDSDVDVIVSNTRSPVAPDTLQIFFNDGNGEFIEGEQMITPGFQAGDPVIIDIDNDGDLDIVNSIAIGGQQHAIRSFLNGGKGVFTAFVSSDYETVSPFFGFLNVGDLNGDSNLDVVVGSSTVGGSEPDGYVYRLGNGDGSFQPEVFIDETRSVREHVGIFDVDQDGLTDIVTTPTIGGSGESRIRVFLNEDNTQFNLDLDVPFGFSPNDIVVEDFNGNGAPEIFVPYSSGNIEISSFACQEFLPGDVNLDGSVNLLDVDPFIVLLNTGEFQIEADIRRDNAINLNDVGPFVQILAGPK